VDEKGMDACVELSWREVLVAWSMGYGMRELAMHTCR
jgi:hypothetical protein